MKRFLYIAICILLCVGCGPETEDITILESSEISLTWKGAVQMRFSEETCQLAHNDQRNEYRVYDDKLANWFTVRCSEEPTEEGQELSADVSWTGDRSPKTYEGLHMRVEKVSEEGLIWLWNKDNRIGIIIKNIQ